MIASKGWKWEFIKEDENNIWKNPCIESYYLLNRWMSQGKTEFLDLGCGLGRQAISEIKRVLKTKGECYLTLGSKESLAFQQNFVNHIEDFWESNGKAYSAFHYHVLLQKG